IEAIPFSDQTFDAVVCSEVLEHLGTDTLRAGLAEIRRVLRQGGELHGTVPADENLADLQTVCPHCGEGFHRWGPVQSFSPDRLAEFLRAVGTPCIERKLFVHWPSLNWKGKAGAMLQLCLAKLGSYSTMHNLYFRVC